MSESQEIQQLKTKHEKLEDALAAEANKIHPDPMTIAEIKKKKLHLKDEMARLQHD